MKIILFSPAWSARHGRYNKLIKIHGENPPLGLAYLASAVKNIGDEVKIIDGEIQSQTPDSLVKEVLDFKADLVGISATTPIFDIASIYAKRIKEFSSALTILGGQHLTALKEKTFSEVFDFGVIGEGEATLQELIDALKKKKDLSKIEGLIYREDKALRINHLRNTVDMLEDISWPDRSLLSNNRYKITVPQRGEIITTGIIASRGCPFHCTFCTAPRFYGGKIRFRDPVDVVNEMEESLNRFNISHFRFYDSTLTLKKEQILGICEQILSRKVKLTWEGWTRANLIDRNLIRRMKEAGFVRISFGLESANENILKLIKKEVSKEEVSKAVEICREEGLEVTCSVMIGNPGETRQTVKETIHFLRSLNGIPYVPLSIATPYPGTEFYEMANRGEYGLKIISHDYSRYLRYDSGVVQVNDLRPNDLLRLQKWGLIWIHLRFFRICYLLRKTGLRFLLTALIFLFNRRKVHNDI